MNEEARLADEKVASAELKVREKERAEEKELLKAEKEK